MIQRVLLTILIFTSACLRLEADIQNDGKTVLCFVGHKTSHGFGNHEYMAGCHLIEEWLKKTYPEANIEGRYAVPWPENEEEFFKDADAVIFFCSGGGGHVVNRHVPVFDKVMRTGAGLACLHYAVEVPIGPSAKGMLAWMGGYFEKNWSVNPHWVAEFKTFPTGHPAARGIKPFKADDEWYFHMRFQGDMKGVTPILSAIAPPETMKRKDGPHSGNPTVRKAVANKEPQHVAWAYQRGDDYKKGRGYGFTGLHYHWNWQDDNFRKTVLNGVAWTAHLDIPENGIETETPTKEYLSENAAKWGGDQNRKRKSKPAPKANPKAKALFKSKPVENNKTEGHQVAIDIEIPAGATELYLRVDDLDSHAFDWANWAEPRIILADGSEKKLTDLNWINAHCGWGQVRKNLNAGGSPMKVLGTGIKYGIGTHAPSLISYRIPPGTKRFVARGVLDDGGTSQSDGNAPSSVSFSVYVENPGLPSGGSQSGNSTKRTPEEAIPSLEVHPELEAQLFASEPMITSPSSIDIDGKGRIWVCDVVNYRRNQGKRPEGDQILILEDTDGDAKADKKTVFYQGHDVDSAHGICVLGDRVIISAGEEIFSLYDRDNDGKADSGSKEMMFTKIGGKQHDHGVHAMHFGPDGRLYFNYGNAGKQLCDPEGNLITDINGIPCTVNTRPYQQGMVFRCDPDGKNVEMLGWNFRNNWEVCVDSFGTVWQSDNDDDGNKGVRINYVMEYGNYGYRDEMTGAGWRDLRAGMHEEIPKRHWHLNDSGVVPNLLQTGAGSPTGICVYEGDLLPEVFRGQVIHCDAGPNVVRAYPAKPDGAGYSAEMVNILKAKNDNWFRPSDVCVAPDGSLFVADWYDPGVGGHGMGDIEKGRIFRMIPKGTATKYEPEKALSMPTNGGPTYSQLSLLNSPNEDLRFTAWSSYIKQGEKAEEALRLTLEENDKNPTLQARAFWLLLEQPDPAKVAEVITLAAKSKNPRLAELAVRGWRKVSGPKSTNNPEYIFTLNQIADLNLNRPAVLREIAIALRFSKNSDADKLWEKLAQKYDGKDRWFLEALGIGADLCWDSRLGALKGDIHPDIVWRSRGSKSADLIADHLVSAKDAEVKFLRAIDFQLPDSRRSAFVKVFMKGQTELALAAAGKLSRGEIAKIDQGEERLNSLLDPIRGKAEFVLLAERLNLRGFEDELADFIAKNPRAPESVNAARLLIRDSGKTRSLLIKEKNFERASALATAIGRTNERSAGPVLAGALQNGNSSPVLKRIVIEAMATGSNSGRELIKLARDGKVEDSLKDTAALALARSPDRRIRNEAASVLPVPKAPGTDKFPAMDELVKMKGSAAKGKEFFVKGTCATCHKVKGEGIEFGPDLSEIGNKLSREAMFQSILYPAAAISHGFHGLTITKKDGTALVGFSTGETDSEWQLRLPGGVQQSVAKKDIAKIEHIEQSLMPPGLANVVGVEGLVDLVTWMQTLK